jgi:hypothetical protein
MKRIAIGAVTALVVVALVLGGITAMAAKPQDAGNKDMDVIAMSNGFPSGPHFNLNIHGKKWETCQAVDDGDGWGSSIFIPEYGDATIQYVTNKKSSVGNLTVLDPCGGFNGENDAAKVQLPYEREGFYVFARILGTPGNKGQNKDGDPNSIILYPNVVVEACNWNETTSESDFGNQTSCEDVVWPLGVIVGNNLYVPNPANGTFERFDPIPSGKSGKGKGRSKGTDITRLFTYTGWVVDSSLDIGSWNATAGSCEAVPDGLITECDVPGTGDVPGNAWEIINATVGYEVEEYDGQHTHIYNCGAITWGSDDGVIDIEEWLAFQEDLWLNEEPGAVPVNYYCEEWILNIADLVVTEQQVGNDGAKLLQIRFYPVATTEYILQ